MHSLRRWRVSWPVRRSTASATSSMLILAGMPGCARASYGVGPRHGGLGLRLRRLGYVLVEVQIATAPGLAPFVRQKTVLLNTYKRDGTPRGTPVSIAVDGDHAVIRSFEKAAKTRAAEPHPVVDIAPSTAAGRPSGPAVRARMCASTVA